VETNQYLSMFIDESKEHLQAMNDHMLQLEEQPDNIDIVHQIFRSAHTLKGMSATMGFEDLASLTHQMENVLDLVRNSKLSMNETIFDTLFKSLDALEQMVDDIINGGTGKLDVTDIVARLKSIEKGEPLEAASSGAQGGAASQASAGGSADITLDEFQLTVMKQGRESGHIPYRIDVVIDQSSMLKAARAYMVFRELEQMGGEVIHSLPSVEDIEQDKFDHSFVVMYLSKEPGEKIQAAIANISEIASVRVGELDDAALSGMSRQASGSGAGDAAREAAAAAAPATAAPAAAGSAPSSRAAADQKPKAAAVASRTIRVDIERLDVLMNLFSELLIDRVRIEALAEEIRRPELTETVEHMARVSSDLQNIVMKLRMMPVESVFNRFPRMVRDLAKSLDKKVNLIITGADTELDRTVIDEIGDPLVHLLRNALDHGIETVQDRIAAGKPETGTLHLRAYHSGNHVYIEIEDDGQGIRRDKVIRSAIKKGAVTEEKAAQMSDQEVYQLLFASGFSTAEKVSDISGRGVGLDVVKTKIVSLGGQVLIESKEGKGSKFIVQLPLTLSIIAAMLIRLGSEKYAIPLSSIAETAIIRKEDVREVHGTQVMYFRDHVIPVVWLKKVLDCPDQDSEAPEELTVVIIRKGEAHAALVVDELIGQQEIVLKTLGKYLSKIFAISGATILGDGHVALIIDPNALVK
jgi:two-component system chemotaxis sensor kinase CheA